MASRSIEIDILSFYRVKLSMNMTSMTKRFSVFLVWLSLCGLVYAKDALPAVNWPADKPLFRFVVSKLKYVGGYQVQQSYILDLAVMNMSGKRISQASFTFYHWLWKRDARILSCHSGLFSSNL